MPKSKQYYDPHGGVAMLRNWIDTLKEKTGRDLDEWTALIKAKAPAESNARRAWLKEKHGLGTNAAGWLADHASGKGDVEEADPEVYLRNAVGYVEALFSGPKTALRPLYDRLYDLARSMGKDIRICPGKTMISIYRTHVIAQIKPATRTRVDFGLALKDTPAKGRLIDTGGLAKKDRITHRIEITSLDDIDDYVEKWLKRACEMDA
ncbi:MAG: hypothetical protein QOC81_2671 [Thermoanaerobaculia bacterium]|jgi:hypothetical protein|nr:hypothetical protein [Thermoanaerobaculia bacterium]